MEDVAKKEGPDCRGGGAVRDGGGGSVRDGGTRPAAAAAAEPGGPDPGSATAVPGRTMGLLAWTAAAETANEAELLATGSNVDHGLDTPEDNGQTENNSNIGNTKGLLGLPTELVLEVTQYLPDVEWLSLKNTCHKTRTILLSSPRSKVTKYSALSRYARFEADANADRDGHRLKQRIPCYYCMNTHRFSKFFDEDKVPGNLMRMCKGACGVVILGPGLILTHNMLPEMIRALELTPMEMAGNVWPNPCNKVLTRRYPDLEWKYLELRDMVPTPTVYYADGLDDRAHQFHAQFPAAWTFFTGKKEANLAKLTRMDYYPTAHALVGPMASCANEITIAINYEIQLVHLAYGRFPVAFFCPAVEHAEADYSDGDYMMVEFFHTRICPHMTLRHPRIAEAICETIHKICERFEMFPPDQAMVLPTFYQHIGCPMCETNVNIVAAKNALIEAPILKLSVHRNLGNANCATNQRWMEGVQTCVTSLF